MCDQRDGRTIRETQTHNGNTQTHIFHLVRKPLRLDAKTTSAHQWTAILDRCHVRQTSPTGTFQLRSSTLTCWKNRNLIQRACGIRQDDDGEEQLAVPRKQAKGKGRTLRLVSRAHPPEQERSNEHMSPGLPPAPKPKAPRSSAGLRKPRGMVEHEAWNAASFLRDTRMPISLIQLAHLAPKGREAVAEALRLEPHPDSKTGQKLQARRAAQQAVMEVNNVELVSERTPRRRQRSRPATSIPGNFYTTAVVKSLHSDNSKESILLQHPDEHLAARSS